MNLPIRVGDVLFAGRAAEARLNELGVRPPGGHRLARAVRHLAWCLEQAERHGAYDTDRVRFSESVRTVLHQYLIGQTLTRADGSALGLLKETLNGHDTPAGDLHAGRAPQTKARDTETELLVYALMRLARFAGVRIAEPDLRVRAGDVELGVAVKSLWSAEQLERRVVDGVRQIRRETPAGGVLVLGLDAQVLDVDPAVAHATAARLTARARDVVLARGAGDAVGLVFGRSTVARVDPAYAPPALPVTAPWPTTVMPPLLALGASAHAEVIQPPGDGEAVKSLLLRAGEHLERALARLFATARDPDLLDPGDEARS